MRHHSASGIAYYASTGIFLNSFRTFQSVSLPPSLSHTLFFFNPKIPYHLLTSHHIRIDPLSKRPTL